MTEQTSVFGQLLISGTMVLIGIYSYFVLLRNKLESKYRIFLHYNVCFYFVALVYWFKLLKFETAMFGPVNRMAVAAHYLLLQFFLLQSINIMHRKFVKYFYLFTGVSVVIMALYDATHKSNFAFVFANLTLLCTSFYYFVHLLRSHPQKNLVSDATFWIATGIFLGMASVIPMNLALVFSKLGMTVDAMYILGLLGLFPYFLMHLFFLKGYLCLAKQS